MTALGPRRARVAFAVAGLVALVGLSQAVTAGATVSRFGSRPLRPERSRCSTRSTRTRGWDCAGWSDGASRPHRFEAFWSGSRFETDGSHAYGPAAEHLAVYDVAAPSVGTARLGERNRRPRDLADGFSIAGPVMRVLDGGRTAVSCTDLARQSPPTWGADAIPVPDAGWRNGTRHRALRGQLLARRGPTGLVDVLVLACGDPGWVDDR